MDTTPSTLIDFLHARFDEREAVARAAMALAQIADRITTSSCQEFADHIALNDPAYVLADIAAKREVVEQHDPYGHENCPRCRGTRNGRLTSPCYTLRWLVLPLAEHPDYREEWKP